MYINAESIKSYRLSDLGETETFYSNNENAQVQGTPEAGYTSFKASLPPLSIMAVCCDTRASIPTGLNEELINDNLINLYPNPLQGNRITIKSSLEKIDFINLVSSTGKTVKSIENPSKELDIGELLSGFYVVQVFSDGNIFEKKILID